MRPLASITLLLSIALAACGAAAAPPPSLPSWPARPFRVAEARSEPDPVRQAIARRVYEDQLQRLEDSVGPYVAHGGTLVAGTVSTDDRTWPVVGTVWAAHGFSGAALVLAQGDGHATVHCEPDELDHDEEGQELDEPVARVFCDVFTSLVVPGEGTVAPSVLATTASFDATVGIEPFDTSVLHFDFAPSAGECPDWVLREVRAGLAQRGAIVDDGGVWSYVEEREVAELLSEEAGQCCSARARARARSWIEARCPGRYGVDVELSELTRMCEPCMRPPQGGG